MHHHRQADVCWTCFEIAKGTEFCHPTMLQNHSARLKQASSDKTINSPSYAKAMNLRLHQHKI